MLFVDVPAGLSRERTIRALPPTAPEPEGGAARSCGGLKAAAPAEEARAGPAAVGPTGDGTSANLAKVAEARCDLRPHWLWNPLQVAPRDRPHRASATAVARRATAVASAARGPRVPRHHNFGRRPESPSLQTRRRPSYRSGTGARRRRAGPPAGAGDWVVPRDARSRATAVAPAAPSQHVLPQWHRLGGCDPREPVETRRWWACRLRAALETWSSRHESGPSA